MNKFLKITLHLSVWFVLFLSPWIIFQGRNTDFTKLIYHNWVPLSFYAIIFYMNYFILLDRFYVRKKHLIYFTMNVLVLTGFILINYYLRDYFMGIEKRPGFDPQIVKGPEMRISEQRPMPPPKFIMLMDIFSFCIPVVFSIAVKTTERLMNAEAEKKEIETGNLRSELNHLKYQLQPHFFFNALNNIYALVEKSPEKAKEAIHGMSKLMRYMLYETETDKVELKDEILFIERYLELTEIRLQGNVKTSFHFPDIKEARSFKTAPLIFIPLLENAFKHGISATEKSFVKVDMSIIGNLVLFVCENSNFPKSKDDLSGSGIGLDNLKRRLDLLYPGRHDYSEEVSEKIYRVRVKIELDN